MQKTTFYTAEDPWLLKPEVAARLRVSNSTIERGVRQGWFPQPKKIGLRKIAWRASVITEYERNRVSSTTDLPSNAGEAA